MSRVTQEMHEWLASALVPARSTLVHAVVFGSVAAGSSGPGDCDVVLVSAADPNSDEWHALRASITLLRGDFLQHFGIPLSVILLTTQEWEEMRGFFICQIRLFDHPANNALQLT